MSGAAGASGLGRGPLPVPGPVVLGADGCPGNGWVALALGPDGSAWHHVVGAEALRRLADELGASPSPSTSRSD